MLLERGNDFTIVLLTGLVLRRNDQCIEPALACGGDSWRVWLVGDDDGDAGVGNPSCIDAVGDGDEVGAASREEDAERIHGVSAVSYQMSALSFQPVHHSSPA